MIQPGTGTDWRGRNSSYHKNHNWWRWERQQGNEVQNSIGQQGRVKIKVRRAAILARQNSIQFSCFRSKEAEKLLDRQLSTPNGYVSTTSPITIKKVVIKRETLTSKPTSQTKDAETATATATINIQPAVVRTARIKINVVKPSSDNKENEEGKQSERTKWQRR